jgi:putative intracellular protease/amidase
MLPTAPRHFMPSPALPGAGLPHDRLARMAARHAFAVLKAAFQNAVEDVAGNEGGWLRHQVRAAEEPTDLWLLRAPVFAVLAGPGLERRTRRQALRRNLELLFPDSEPPSGFVAF